MAFEDKIRWRNLQRIRAADAPKIRENKATRNVQMGCHPTTLVLPLTRDHPGP